MTWFTWRQFRTQAWIAIVALGAVAAVLAVTSRTLGSLWTASGVASCGRDCNHAIDNFNALVSSGVTGVIYEVVLALTYAVPALIGVFWGAPLIARELEAGTQRLAWTQSITRTRWLATKIALVGAASAVTAGLVSWAASSWSARIDTVQNYRITPMIYGARGIVPIGYALFAFMLGATMGLLLRRATPAMAATLAVYVGAVTSMALWIRAHLSPVLHAVSPLDINQIRGFGISDNGVMEVVGGALPNKAWVLTNTTVTTAGQPFVGPASHQYCSNPNQGPHACLNWVASLGLRQDITYQPASHFWPLQWTETGIFVALALLLAGFCFWRIGRSS